MHATNDFLLPCCRPEDVEGLATKMLGYNLVTKQTPADGVLVKRVSSFKINENYKNVLLIVHCAVGGINKHTYRGKDFFA